MSRRNPRPDQSYVDNQTSRHIVGFFDVDGQPPGLIPLGRTSEATQITTPAPVNKPAPGQEPTPEPQSAVPEVEAQGEDDGTNLTTHKAGEDKETARSDQQATST